MSTLQQVIDKVNNVLDEQHLDGIARACKFLQRKRKIRPKSFLENMLCLTIGSLESSLEELSLEFKKQDCNVTKSALHKKVTEAGVNFFKGVLESLFKSAFNVSVLYLNALEFIKNVKVVDSSEVKLNKKLKIENPQVRGQGAAIKLQALIDAISGGIFLLDIQKSKQPDQSYKSHLDHIQRNDLLIADLGYFCVESFRLVEEKLGYFLSRFFKNTKIYDLITNKEINLRKLLSETIAAHLDFKIALGAIRFPCRMVALKLPEEAYQKRLKVLVEKKRKDPRANINLADELHRWTILVTNLPAQTTPLILLQIYSIRWQIELFFKMMKNFMNLREILSSNPHRANMSLYASMIAIVLLSLIVMATKAEEISLYKAGKIFANHIREFIERLNNKTKCAVSWMTTLFAHSALKESRPNRPSTRKHLVLRPENA